MYFPNMSLNGSKGGKDSIDGFKELNKILSKRDNNWNSFSGVGKSINSTKPSPYISMGNKEEHGFRSVSSHSNTHKPDRLRTKISHGKDNIKISDESVLAMSDYPKPNNKDSYKSLGEQTLVCF